MALQEALSVLSVTPERASGVASSQLQRPGSKAAAARPLLLSRAGSGTPPRGYTRGSVARTASPLSGAAARWGASELAYSARPRMATVLRPADRCACKPCLKFWV